MMRKSLLIGTISVDSDGIVVVYRHYFYWIASLFLIPPTAYHR